MRGKLMFIAGVGVGYVLGTRAGRERFDQLVAQARKAWESPTVQEAAGVLQAQADKLYGQGKDAMTMQMRRMGARANARRAERRQDEAWDAASNPSEFPADAF